MAKKVKAVEKKVKKTKNKNKAGKKIKTVGIFSLTSCSGCQMEILNFNKELLDFMTNFRILHFPMLKEYNENGPFDIVLVEGCVTTEKQKKELKEIRKKSKFLVAMGTCATFGGIPSIKNFMDPSAVERKVYHDTTKIASIRVSGLDKFVRVDYYLHGCPLNKEDFLRLFNGLSIDKVPDHIDYPVCVECRKKGNPCLLQEGKPCMGPITYAGCGAECPSLGIPCQGCRGPLEDANVAIEAKLFKKQGIQDKDIERYFRTFAGTSRVFQDYCHEHRSPKTECAHLHKKSYLKIKDEIEHDDIKI